MASKQATFLLVAAVFLFLIYLQRGQAARPEPKSDDHNSQALEEAMKSSVAAAAATDAHQEKVMGVEMDQEEPEETTGCEGEEAVEECLVRRTLVAHTDYIYTQGKHN